MKHLSMAILTVLMASCTLDLAREELILDLPSYYNSVRPSVKYSLTGGSHLQGYIRLYKAGEEGLPAASLSGFDTLIPYTSTGQGQFQFRSNLEEGAYLLQSSLAVNRGGIVSVLLGSTKEAYFSIIPRPELPPAAPIWKIVTDRNTGRLNLRLVHSLRLDVWTSNPVTFHALVAQSSDPGVEPADPAVPDPAQAAQQWNIYKELQAYRDPGNGSVYRWIKARASARLAGGSLSSSIAEFEHRFNLQLSNVILDGQVLTNQVLRKSKSSSEIRITPQWTLYGADGAALAASAETDVLVTIVNKADGTFARIPLNLGTSLGARNQVLPLSSGIEIPLEIRSSDLSGLSVLGTSPNSELILTISDKAFGGYPIHVAE